MINKYSDYITERECNFLLENKTPGQAAVHHHNKEEPDGSVKKLLNQLGYEYSFVFVFAPAVKGLYPIIKKLVTEMELPQEISKSSIVYLTVCLMGILLSEPKEKYKDLITKLKNENIFHLIKPLITSMKGIKSVFNFISAKLGKIVTSFGEMFAYTALFVPFALIFNDIGQQSDTSISSILTAISTDGVGKLLVTGIGVGIFAIKHFMVDIIKGLKSFNDIGILAVKRVIDKIKNIKFPKLFPDEEIETEVSYNKEINPVDNYFNESKILNFSEYQLS